MKLFILENCVHCMRARKWLQELCSEYPQYQVIEVEVIDENINSEIADKYDYYYVPTIFYNQQKLHEGVASKEKLHQVLETILKNN